MGQETLRMYCPDEQKMVLAVRKTPNHILHLLLSIITGGLWLLVWITVSLNKKPALCSSCGARTMVAPPVPKKKKQWFGPI